MDRKEFVDYVDLNRRIKELEAKVKDLRKEREKHEPAVLELMSQLGVTSVKAAGATVYLHRQLWANARQYDGGVRDYATACGALVECGHPEMVETKFNVMRVSSLVRELDEKDDIPIELYEALDITEKVQARVRG